MTLHFRLNTLILSGFSCFSFGADDDFLDLDALMQMDVQATTALKRASSVRDTAASVYVIDSEELHLHGIRSVPEALKLVPGVFVRQIDNNVWAISTRFAASQFYSRMLVMVDGQNVYNPTFAGIAWEELDIDIDTIERIEVIRGTGGMLWGANATNGVVNIITKHSFDTQGVEGRVTVSSLPGYAMALKYGGGYGDDVNFRIGITTTNHEKANRPDDANDEGRVTSLGLRWDYSLTPQLEWQWHTRLLRSDIAQVTRTQWLDTPKTAETIEGEGLSMMTRLVHNVSPYTSQQFQVSYQYSNRPQIAIDIKYQSWDIDYQYNHSWDNKRLDFGTYIRHNDVLTDDGLLVTLSENDTNLDIYGAFLQFEWAVRETTKLLFAGKLEHNNYHGWGFQPSVRLLQNINQNHSFWLGYSEVERTPTFGEYSIEVNSAQQPFSSIYTTGVSKVDNYLVKAVIRSNNELDADRSENIEAGYRYYPDQDTFLDVSAFYSTYRNSANFDIEIDQQAIESIVTLAQIGDISGAQNRIEQLRIGFQSVGGGKLDIYGVEASLSQILSERFRLQLGVSLLDMHYRGLLGEIYGLGVSDDIVQSKLKMTYLSAENFNFSAMLTHESESDIYGTDDYWSMSLGGNYRFSDRVSAGLFIKNVFVDGLEYGKQSDIYIHQSEIEPYVMGTIVIGF
ncbi:TonB-dependent receptor plug domain-containing protein [Thaumasiovibrio subtropicus]|uniref:TonB-dependent receptor plug domain-containing protein n=1 Tax=Thaumasiovibrio subtropicus TaxID=1891207 RepID=UPI00131C52BF|nr:TonB-dependent receptor [Thaumasiovibrio subtropicus]